MKKSIITFATVLTLLGAGVSTASAYTFGNDYDAIRQGQSGQEVGNQDVHGKFLPQTTNFELYNYVGQHTEYGGHLVVRQWQPKSEASVINDVNDYSLDNGNKVYNFDSFGYQLPQITDFGSKIYIGYFQLKDGTIYRYWK